MSLPIKPLMGVGAGLGTGVAGFLFGNKKGQEDSADVFKDYNEEENMQVANTAFMNGVQYALDNMGNYGIDKQSSYTKILCSSFIDEIEKTASLPSTVGKFVKDNFYGGIQKLLSTKQTGKNIVYKARDINAAKKNLTHIGMVSGGIGAGVVGAKVLD
jgi:hypothetical protein